MNKKSVVAILIVFLIGTFGAKSALSAQKKSQSRASASVAEISALNDALKRATESMDNSATMALWDEEGTTLLPGQAAVTGKANIAKWLDGVTANLKGWKVLKQEQEFHDIQVSGNWASEWATTAQTVQPSDGKPSFTAKGKMLLVLHRGNDSKWKIREEAWNGQ